MTNEERQIKQQLIARQNSPSLLEKTSVWQNGENDWCNNRTKMSDITGVRFHEVPDAVARLA